MISIPPKPRVIALEDINRRATSPEELVAYSEDRYTRRINDVAEGIAQRFHRCPIVLLSGPSGSGKTTTAARLGERLKYYGIESIVISLDDYFLPGRPLPDENGVIDYEKPDRVDARLLSHDLEILEAGGEVTLPSYDFTYNIRSAGKTIRRKENNIIILEGIHTLNPAVTGEHHDFATFVYVSVRTRIAADSGELLHPSMIRLLRRLSRDKLFRGRDFADTMRNFGSVQRGESLYIMPYKKYAHFDIDTFFEYELGIYRSVLPELIESEELREQLSKITGISANDAPNILPKFIRAASEISPKLVPEYSVIREFIG